MPSARLGAAESITRARRIGEQPMVLVRTVTGLERLAAAELATANHRVIDLSKRQLIVEPTSATIITDPPRLADDLFIVQAAAPDPGRTRPALAAAVSSLDLGARPPGDLAVSASFQGARNYNRYDVEDVIGEALGGRYHSRRHGTAPPTDRVDWRVVLDGRTMWVGFRPFDLPLHRREYRRRTVTGSLHPPVAAAMARLAGITEGHRVLDPFCGAGTLLLEAQAIEPTATFLGTDRSSSAITAARANTPTRACIRWRVGDARYLSEQVHRIVTNPPWDVRLAIGDLSPYLDQWHRHVDGRVVAILHQEQSDVMVRDPAWRVLDGYDIAVAGQHPRILVAEPT